MGMLAARQQDKRAEPVKSLRLWIRLFPRKQLSGTERVRVLAFQAPCYIMTMISKNANDGEENT